MKAKYIGRHKILHDCPTYSGELEPGEKIQISRSEYDSFYKDHEDWVVDEYKASKKKENELKEEQKS